MFVSESWDSIGREEEKRGRILYISTVQFSFVYISIRFNKIYFNPHFFFHSFFSMFIPFSFLTLTLHHLVKAMWKHLLSMLHTVVCFMSFTLNNPLNLKFIVALRQRISLDFNLSLLRIKLYIHWIVHRRRPTLLLTLSSPFFFFYFGPFI